MIVTCTSLAAEWYALCERMDDLRAISSAQLYATEVFGFVIGFFVLVYVFRKLWARG